MRFALLSCGVLAACGSTNASGTIDGRPFKGSQAWSTDTTTALELHIEENVNRCSAGPAPPANRYQLVASLSEWNGSALVPATKPGTYTILSTFCTDKPTGKLFVDCTASAPPAPAGALYASAQFRRDGKQTPLAVIAGSVTLHAASPSPGAMAGDFSVFVGADKLAGDFIGAVCDVKE